MGQPGVGEESPIRSDQAAGNNGSWAGHSTVSGTVIRSADAGGFGRDRATGPALARYHFTEAVNAPSGA